jgi:hypothetical protein
MDAVRNAVNDLTLPELYAELSKTGCLLHHAAPPAPVFMCRRPPRAWACAGFAGGGDAQSNTAR